MIILFAAGACSPEHPVRGEEKPAEDSDTAVFACADGLEITAEETRALGAPVEVPHGPVTLAWSAAGAWIGTNSSATRVVDGVATDVWTQPDDGMRVVPAVADLDGDGVDDLVLGLPGSDDGAGQVVIVPGPIGDSVDWSTPHLEWKGTAGAGWSVVPADINGDGAIDLAVRDNAELWMLWGPIQEDGLVAEPDAVLLPRPAGAAWFDARVGDVDADGIADLVAAAVVPDEARGGSVLVPTVFSVLGPFGESFALGVPDDLWLTPSLYQSDITDDGTTVYSGLGLLVADVDGDGVDDVLATGVSLATETYGLAEAAVWLGPVDGDAAPDTRFALPGGLLGVGDVNGDGTLDVVAASLAAADGPSVLYGPVTGLPPHDPTTCVVAVDEVWTNPSPWDSLGAAGLGDPDGDGILTAVFASSLTDGTGRVQGMDAD